MLEGAPHESEHGGEGNTHKNEDVPSNCFDEARHAFEHVVEDCEDRCALESSDGRPMYNLSSVSRKGNEEAR